LPFSRLRKKAAKPLSEKYVTNPKTLGHKIRNRRLELSLLQRELAQVIGVSEDSITYWEMDRVEPSVLYYPKIMEFLGLDPFPHAESIAGAIIRYRYLHGLTIKQMAKKVKVAPTTVRDWEKGNTAPQGKNLERLAVYLRT
jgi:DNA-binding XRE family transcriptional regulator